MTDGEDLLNRWLSQAWYLPNEVIRQIIGLLRLPARVAYQRRARVPRYFSLSNANFNAMAAQHNFPLSEFRQVRVPKPEGGGYWFTAFDAVSFYGPGY